MIGANRHLVTAGSECSEMVYASDYDRLAQECERLRGARDSMQRIGVRAAEDKVVALKQVEALRAGYASMNARFAQLEFEVGQGKHTAMSLFTQMRTAALQAKP